MPDGFVRLRLGEKKPLYGEAAVPTGTLTIQASPAPVCTLYDSGGAAVPGFESIAVSGYDAGALPNPRAWLNLDTTSLSPGWYTLVFQFTAAGSDSITRVFKPSLELRVLKVTG